MSNVQNRLVISTIGLFIYLIGTMQHKTSWIIAKLLIYNRSHP